MRTELDNSGVLSMGDFINMCDRIGNKPGRVSLKGYKYELFSNFGIRALPHVFPDLHPVHIAVEPAAKTIDMIEPNGHNHLPKEIEGVPIDDIVAYTAFNISHKPGENGQQQRIAAADGSCYRTSRNGLLSLLDNHPQLQPHAMMSRIEPVNRLAVPTDANSYPGVVRLADGHSIAAISYMAGTSPMELLIDPTIAQVDQTHYYDIEVTGVPKDQVADYMRLRYSSTPIGRVTKKKP